MTASGNAATPLPTTLPNRPQHASTPPQQSKIQHREDITR
jgi:hypothetical protein